MGGLGQVGTEFRVQVARPPLAPFLLAASSDATPEPLAGGTHCLGPAPRVLLDGFSNPAFRLSAMGSFESQLGIPDRLGLVGATIWLQAVVQDPASPLGGGLAISPARTVDTQPPSSLREIFFDDFEGGQRTRCSGTVLDGRDPSSGADLTP